MAEQTTDESQKTEEPTQKRLEDSREKGQVPVSREINHWFMIFAAALFVMLVAPSMMRDLMSTLARFIEAPHAIPVDFANLRGTLADTASDVLGALMMPMLIMVVAALLAGVVQTGLLFAPDKIKPKLEKISMLAGAKRMFSSQSLSEFAKGLFKIAIVGAVATMLMLPELAVVDQLVGANALQMLDVMHGLVIRLLIGVVSVITVIAALDLLYVRFQHKKQLRMSRQDIKDEMKQSEGDPLIRQRLRQIRQERARSRMMAAVPDATVVITNPTHFAVALKYEPDKMPAPVLLAKGVDHLATRIREVAKEHGIPIIENPPIAQALYAGVEINDEIPPDHYKAVAEIIGYVMRLKGQMPAGR